MVLDQTLTRRDIKRNNRLRIYNRLREAGSFSCLDISMDLGLSLPTVGKNISDLEEAGLVLAVFDLAAPLNEEDLEIARRCQGRPALAILNKQDLAGQGEAFTAAQQQLAPYFKAIIPLTARDAASLQPLCQAVAQLLGTANLDPNAAALCSARQLSAAKEARDALAEALNSQEDGFGLDAAGVCISDAQRALARLTGEDATEATIDEVFSTFCVGK